MRLPPYVARLALRASPAPRIRDGVRVLMLLTVVGQLGDAITFAIGSQMIGIGYESNGLVQAVYQHAGLTGVLLLKGWVILLCVSVLMILAERLPRAFVIGALFAGGLGLLGIIANTMTVAAVIG